MPFVEDDDDDVDVAFHERDARVVDVVVATGRRREQREVRRARDRGADERGRGRGVRART